MVMVWLCQPCRLKYDGQIPLFKQNITYQIEEDVVCRGVKHYVAIHQNSAEFGESWSALCSMVPKYTNIPQLTDEFDEVQESEYREWSVFRSQKELQIDLCPAEVELIQGMTFSPTASLDEVPGLFAHPDGSTTTKLREESKHLFGKSASSSFFAFIPISFWKQVVTFSNGRAAETSGQLGAPIELEELMIFLGIQWYMTLVDKGEMRNYWFDNEDSNIFPGQSSTSLATVMSWKRYLYIRKILSFRPRTSAEELSSDPAASIRPLITILKIRCCRHVIPGRDVAVDEASIASKSKYARHIIVYNPRKPTGKYHFKLYVCCCSTTWIVLDFKLHCSSDLKNRLANVISPAEIDRLAALTEKSSEIRKHVIEVTNSLRGSRRVVNTDNFYTSCLLLESLRTVGLYGRGTVRSSSKHFPRYTMVGSTDTKRGTMKQGVCVEKHIVAASWVDGSVVNVISNADDSGTTTVYRRIRQQREPFKAPKCVSEYNTAMQGVDRHDQLRGRFSVANGHTFKKWYKKLAMAMIDIARCNAYICHQMARRSNHSGFSDGEDSPESSRRDEHRAFVASLVREMFDGTWKESLSDDDGMLFANSNDGPTSSLCHAANTAVSSGTNDVCVARESWIALKDRSRAIRECTVCRFECRNPTQKTDYCEKHKAALCKRTYPIDKSKPHLCQEASWSCWQKYHGYYLPNLVYNLEGHLMRSSSIYKMQAPFLRSKASKRTTR
uniref:Transposase n=1 Tax=Phytophthora infestans TaxID=4787 RepID=Q5MGB3_PHYIN|nr:transposase [Phytophthora infestans]